MSKSGATGLALIFVAGASLALGACMNPIEPDTDYEVELAVAGGVAGAQYAFRIEGLTGQVLGGECVAACDWQAGEVIAELPLSKRMAIESQFALAGFLDLAQAEYGVACCESVEYTLTYRKDGRAHTVHGSPENLPAEVETLVAAVHGVVLTE